MGICYILIGVPGSGKSTFIEENLYDFPRDADGNLPWVTGTDLYIDRVAEALEMTYSEVFKDSYKLAEKCFWADIQNAAAEGDSIIIDRTNMTRTGRKKFFTALHGYRFEAIVFPLPTDLEQRLASRPGKEIGMNIIDSMLANYSAPSFQEGFDAIWSPKMFSSKLEIDHG